MKKFYFVVTLISGLTFTQSGEGRNVDDALLDACWHLSDTSYPEDDIVDINVIDEEEQA